MDQPTCFFCGEAVPSEDYCYGCKEYVCTMCTQNPRIKDDHSIEDHMNTIGEVIQFQPVMFDPWGQTLPWMKRDHKYEGV